MEKAFIVGAGTYGQVYYEYLKHKYKIQGFIDDDKTLHGTQILGISILGGLDYLENNFDKSVNVFVPIGNNKLRVYMLEKLQKWGYKTPSFIHDNVCIHNSVEVGKAVYILPSSSIMPFVKLKDYVMISLGVNVAHHTVLSKGVFLSQGSNIGASINIGENTFCGIASNVMTGVNKVGKNSILGAGTVVIKCIPINATIVGNPGRIIKINE
jgi:sugar O-acyltransferase (sialic acid O-acetyltransferase NeuD family)